MATSFRLVQYSTSGFLPLASTKNGCLRANTQILTYPHFFPFLQADRRTALFLNQLFILRDVRLAGNNSQNQASKSRKKKSVDDEDEEEEDQENGEETKRSSEDEEDEDNESTDESESDEEDDDDDDGSIHSAEEDDELGVFSDKKSNKNEAANDPSETASKVLGTSATVTPSTGQGANATDCLRPPHRLRFEDMTLSMRKRLGGALHDGGAHFVFGGSRCAHLRRESPRDALMRHDTTSRPSSSSSSSLSGGGGSKKKSNNNNDKDEWFKARSSIGTRRVCGEEWLSLTTGGRAGSVGRSSMTRSSMARASMGRSSLGRAITASLARPGVEARVSESVARISASIARSDRRTGTV